MWGLGHKGEQAGLDGEKQNCHCRIFEAFKLFRLVPLVAEIESSRGEPLGIREVVLAAASPGQEMSLFSFLQIAYSPIVHISVIIKWVSLSLQEVHSGYRGF